MAIEIDYRLSPRWSHTQPVTCDDIQSGQLHYELFLGDITFRIEGADFSATWGWIPVLDFALQLYAIAEELPIVRSRSFRFTESDAQIMFSVDRQYVRVDSNYGTGRGVVAYHEFRQAMESFARRVVSELDDRCPGLARNPEVLALMPSA